MSSTLMPLHRGPRATVYLSRAAAGAVVYKVLDVAEWSRWDLLRLDNELALTRDLDVRGTRRALRRDEIEGAFTFEARGDTRVLLGSAAPHGHPLVLGTSSVHTEFAAVERSLTRIRDIGTTLRREGRV